MQPASMLDIFGWPQCYKVVLQKVQVSNSWKGQADLQHRWGCREGAEAQLFPASCLHGLSLISCGFHSLAFFHLLGLFQNTFAWVRTEAEWFKGYVGCLPPILKSPGSSSSSAFNSSFLLIVLLGGRR